jgi:hypothetical protein
MPQPLAPEVPARSCCSACRQTASDSFPSDRDPSQPAFGVQFVERALVALYQQHIYGDRVDWEGEYLPHSLAAARSFMEGDMRQALQFDPTWAEAGRRNGKRSPRRLFPLSGDPAGFEDWIFRSLVMTRCPESARSFASRRSAGARQRAIPYPRRRPPLLPPRPCPWPDP